MTLPGVVNGGFQRLNSAVSVVKRGTVLVGAGPKVPLATATAVRGKLHPS